jgi:uncharacterized cupredoxin-like copper-binding protein
MKAISLCASLALAVVVSAGAALAKGDLAIKAEKLEPLVLGSKESDYAMSVKEYSLETGKAYRWKIIGSGLKEYAIVAPQFFRNIWIRKIEAGNMEIKAAVLDELEFEDEAEAELFFVPIRPGVYEFKARGLEERGMIGRIIVR